jgi:glycosyltransferase involved in cell wall biosynthesis
MRPESAGDPLLTREVAGSSPLAVCFFGDYDPGYPREVVLKRGLERNQGTVFECNIDLKRTEPRYLRMKAKPSYVAAAYPRLLETFRRAGQRFSHLFIPHNNHLIVPLGWYLARRNGMRLVMDAFDPAFQSAVMGGAHRLEAGIRYLLEKLALVAADRVLVETEEFKTLYVSTYGLGREKIAAIPVGADEAKFSPRPLPRTRRDARFTVVYWGEFHRHHGIETILQAATQLRSHPDIVFVLAGTGMQRNLAVGFARELALTNVSLPGFLPHPQLVELIESADVCLGIFSRHPLALASIGNKVYQSLAMKKAVVTEDSAAARSALPFADGVLVPPESPEALAAVLVRLREDHELRRRLEEQGYGEFKRRFSEVAIGARFAEILGAAPGRGRGGTPR